jgi:hypothetical protein
MRQFKVINTTPDLQSGLTIANFGMPIKLLPESQVTLDKFAAQIDTRNSDIYFVDLTLSTLMTNHVTGSIATVVTSYAIPSPGVRLIAIFTDDPLGTISAILIEWDAQTIP